MSSKVNFKKNNSPKSFSKDFKKENNFKDKKFGSSNNKNFKDKKFNNNNNKEAGFKRPRSQSFDNNDKQQQKKGKTFEVEDNSNLSISKQKKLKKEDRKKTRKNYDLVTQSKTYWEQIRDKENISDSDRKKLISELLSSLKDQMMTLIRKHDGSRVLQTCIKWGTPEQRTLIINELTGNFKELAKDKYSHHLVIRCLKYGLKQQKLAIIKEFYGKIVQLTKHSHASEVVEYFYKEIANNSQKHLLVSEFYGPEFALFKDEKPKEGGVNLKKIIEDNPEKKEGILKNLQLTLSHLIDKSMVYHSIVHHVAKEYFENAEISQRVDFASIVAPVVIHFVKSKEGSHVAVKCVSYSNAKQRKAIIKLLKGELVNVCREEYGHLMVVRLLDVTDDTVLLQKSVLSEMMKDLDTILGDKHGRLTFLQLLAPSSKRYFPAASIELLQPTLVPNEAGELVPTSKKDPEVKRKALLQYVSSAIIDYCKRNVINLISCFSGSGFLLETALHAIGSKHDLFEAIADSIEEKVSEEKDDVVLTHMVSSRLLKQLIKTEAHIEDLDCPFVNVLFKKLQGNLLAWAGKKGSSFVVASLLEHKDTKDEAAKELKKGLKKIKEYAEKEKGAKVILDLLTK